MELLGPLEAATREMCRETATAAYVIPMVTDLKLQLNKPTSSNMNVLKNAILGQLGRSLSPLCVCVCVCVCVYYVVI